MLDELVGLDQFQFRVDHAKNFNLINGGKIFSFVGSRFVTISIPCWWLPNQAAIDLSVQELPIILIPVD
jgi:hypothetical protein